MDLDKALKKTKTKRGTVKTKKRAKPFVATTERPYQNDLETPVPPVLNSEKSSAAIVYTLLSCFAHDAFDEAKQRATQAANKVKLRLLKFARS